MLYLIRRLVMKLNHPTALPAEAPVAVPGIDGVVNDESYRDRL